MATLDYIDVPSAATRLANANDIRPAHKVLTSLPTPSSQPPSSPSHRRSSSYSNAIVSPTFALLPQFLLSSTVPSAPPPPPPDADDVPLLSVRDPLSLPTMSSNFRRFVARVGPVFWLQDRVEEIVMWRRGWKVTSVWMAGYAFLCYFPRLVLLMPHVALIAIILSSYAYPAPMAPPVTEGSVPWQANIQAIQNLMGFYADADALIQPHTIHLSLSPPTRQPVSQYTLPILVLLLISFPPLLILISLPIFPIHAVFLIVGLAPFVGTNPNVRRLVITTLPLLPQLVSSARRWTGFGSKFQFGSKGATWKTTVQRLIDDDRLSDQCWNTEMREVELWENERLGLPPAGSSEHPTMSRPLSPSQERERPRLQLQTGNETQRGWSKLNLRTGERSAWTRGRDGWSGVGVDGGEVSNLTFSLAPGWFFVDTEDWRKDIGASWAWEGTPAPLISSAVHEEDGWVYTNDAWLNPRCTMEEPGTVTRRRRWVRRVWYDPTRASLPSGTSASGDTHKEGTD